MFRPFAHRPAGALLASADDLAKLVQFWLVRGEGYPPIVSPAGLARIERSGTLPYPHLDSDYGFANYGDVMHPVLSRGHDGGMPGFHASFRYFSNLGVGYAMLLNSNYTFRGYFELRALLFAYLTKGRTFPPPPEPRGDSRASGRGLLLAREPAQRRVRLPRSRAHTGWHVADRGDHVHMTAIGGLEHGPRAGRDGGYRIPRECGSTVRFTTNRDGTPRHADELRLRRGRDRVARASCATSRSALDARVLLRSRRCGRIVLVLGALHRRRVLPAIARAVARGRGPVRASRSPAARARLLRAA